jgi:uroporphyrin-III C-methyltransferase
MPMNEDRTDPGNPAGKPTAAALAEKPSGRSERERAAGNWHLPVILVLLAAIAVVGWQWYDTRSRIAALREEVAERLRASDSTASESLTLAKQAAEGTREAQVKLGVLESKIAESQSEQVALQSLYQELSRNHDEWALADIEQMLTLASQQLQLTGNVQAALLALRTADARLTRSGEPQFIPLRRALERDIERLKAAPNLDITGMALRLDHLIAGVDKLPLRFDERTPGEPNTAAPAAKGGIWERVLLDVLNEMKQLVRIRVMNQPDAALLSPTQSFFLRENLQLRLLDARMALLARDPARFHADLQTARAWMTRYYDMHAKSTVAAMASLKQLEATGIDIELPTIADSLAAVRNFKVPRAKGAR